jgi:hypothetical protein
MPSGLLPEAEEGAGVLRGKKATMRRKDYAVMLVFMMLSSFLGGLVLVGCVRQHKVPTVIYSDEAKYQKDDYECEQKNRRTVFESYRGMGSSHIVTDLAMYYRCMQLRGYTIEMREEQK